MKRAEIKPRHNWQSTVAAQGLSWATTEDGAYWAEAMDKPVYYHLSVSEKRLLELAGIEIHGLMVDAVKWLLELASVKDRRYWIDAFGLTQEHLNVIERSWESKEKGFYGRVDFFMENGTPKLLEYNAESPTTLLESAVIQWRWYADNNLKGQQQFNHIQQAMASHWHDLSGDKKLVHVAHLAEPEELATAKIIADCALDVGLEAELIDMNDIGHDSMQFVDLDNRPMELCFKLYPWHWMMQEDFGSLVATSGTQWLEPAWKSLLSNKAMLALLWYLNPNHANLVETHIERPETKDGDRWVVKPINGSYGQNVQVWSFKGAGRTLEIETQGECNVDEVVFQRAIECDTHDGKYPMLGVWMVDEDAVGLGVRESDTLITANNSRFIPHVYGA